MITIQYSAAHPKDPESQIASKDIIQTNKEEMHESTQSEEWVLSIRICGHVTETGNVRTEAE